MSSAASRRVIRRLGVPGAEPVAATITPAAFFAKLGAAR
jgi:hypothetical protein